MRGTFKGIEVKRRGGVQARPRVGSLKLLQDLHKRQKLSDPLPLRFFLLSSSSRTPQQWGVVFRDLSVVSRRGGRGTLTEGDSEMSVGRNQALTDCGKTISASQNFDGQHVWDKKRTPPRMLKKRSALMWNTETAIRTG